MVPGVNSLRKTGIQYQLDTIIYIKDDDLNMLTNFGTSLDSILSHVPQNVIDRSQLAIYTDLDTGLSTDTFGIYGYQGHVYMYNQKIWLGGLLHHELGHSNGLRHTFCANQPLSYCDGDNLPDTAPDKRDDCDSPNPCSNNVMAYHTRSYFSPQQIAIMRNRIIFNKSHQLVLPPSGGGSQNFHQSDTLKGFHMIPNNELVVKSGATLYIDGTIVMPKDGVIKVEPNARLELLCGGITGLGEQMWNGVQLMGSELLPQQAVYQGSIKLNPGTYLAYAKDAISNCY